jgi:cysteinyl-tRNA synthetase
MRNLVREISVYAKSINPDFIVIAQNGLELLTKNGRSNGKPAREYLDWIDGVGQEHVFYGLDGYDVPTSAAYQDYILGFLEFAKKHRLTVMVIDYASIPAQVEDSYSRNWNSDRISYTPPGGDYDLDQIPENPQNPFNANSEDMNALSEAKNFLYLINASSYPSRAQFLAALKRTHYDILLIDPFYGDYNILTPEEVSSLKEKADGGKRFVIAYMNIGAAEEFRYYWQKSWQVGSPSWIAAPYSDPTYYNEYWVKYWEPGWQGLLFGDEGSYVKRILNAGFDGIYLDNLEAFEFFESIQ